MEKIYRIRQLNKGDVLITVPGTLRLHPDTIVNYNKEDKCYEIKLLPCDIESFGDMIGINKVLFNDATCDEFYLENYFTKQGCKINGDRILGLGLDNKTYWKI